jgi:hypothetical protein
VTRDGVVPSWREDPQQELVLPVLPAEPAGTFLDHGPSFIARDWVTYSTTTDGLEGGEGTTSGDDIQSVSLSAGSSEFPDRHYYNIGGRHGGPTTAVPAASASTEPEKSFHSHGDPPSSSANADVVDTASSEDHLLSFVDLATVRTTMSNVSCLGDDDDDNDAADVNSASDVTPPIMNRSTTVVRDRSVTATINLAVVSSILDKSFVNVAAPPPDGTADFHRMVEGWDVDIKTAVSNLNLMHGFPRGLAFNTARKSRTNLPLRLWLVDNNRATCQGDELPTCLDDHIQISETMEVSSVFCLLNSLQQQIGEFSISSLTEHVPFSLLNSSAVSSLTVPNSLVSGMMTKRIHDDSRQEMHQLIQHAARQKGPRIHIPWRSVLHDAGRQIESADAQLSFHQQAIVICIVCDVMDVTDDIASEMFLLQRLPITFIIRLVGTTGREAETILNLRHQLDRLGLRSVRVIGDHRSHQILTRRTNPWLNCAIPLHRYQEMGLHSRTVSLLEERGLNHHELREFLVLLFGRHVMLEAPDAESEWPAFLRYIKFVNETANKDWDGVSKSTEPWLDIAQLDQTYKLPESRSIIQAVNVIREQARPYSATQVEL